MPAMGVLHYLLLVVGSGAVLVQRSIRPLQSTDEVLARLDFEKNPPPTAFILGEQKCGTSTLFFMLRDHNGVCNGTFLEGETPMRRKEVDFFSKIDVPELISGFPRYVEHFRHCDAEQLRVDATPIYLSRSGTAEHLKEVYTKLGLDVTKLRFLAIFRDPVQRVISAYEHKKRHSEWDETATLEDKISEGIAKYNEWKQQEHEPEDVFVADADMVGRGIYDQSIRHWFQHFDHSQFMFLTLKQLTADPSGVLDAVQEFVGLKNARLVMHKANMGAYDPPPVPPGLVEFYAPHVEALFKLKAEYPGCFYETEHNKFNLDM